MTRMLVVSLLCSVVASCAGRQDAGTSIPTTSTVLAESSSILIEEHTVNSYTVSVLRDKSSGLDTVVVEQNGKVEFKSEPWSWAKIIDLNNDKEPEIVVWQYGGGNHGIFRVQAFTTGSDFTKILETPPSICEGEFKDLNNDGTQEYRTCDSTFVYYNSRCSYANSAFVNAVFTYKEKQGFVLANHEFPQVYDFAADIHTKRIQDFHSDSSWTQEILHEETQCVVLPLVLDYLYSGQSSKAWKVLDDYYHFEDLNSFKSDIQQKAQNSAFFMKP